MHRITGEIRLGANSASGVMTKRVVIRRQMITRRANIAIFDEIRHMVGNEFSSPLTTEPAV